MCFYEWVKGCLSPSSANTRLSYCPALQRIWKSVCSSGEEKRSPADVLFSFSPLVKGVKYVLVSAVWLCAECLSHSQETWRVGGARLVVPADGVGGRGLPRSPLGLPSPQAWAAQCSCIGSRGRFLGTLRGTAAAGWFPPCMLGRHHYFQRAAVSLFR